MWLAVDRDGSEYIFEQEPHRVVDIGGGGELDEWGVDTVYFIELPKGSIEKLLGKPLTWEDEAVCVE